MSLNNRISELLKQKKLNQSQFCNETGFSKQNLSKFLTGSVKHVKIELATVIAERYPEVNLRWLLLGEGEMYHPKDKVFASKLEDENEQLKDENLKLKDELLEAKDRIIELLESK